MNKLTRAVTILILLVTPTRSQDRGGVPVVKITQEGSSIKFEVKASVPIEGVFDKWDATLTFSSTDAEAGVLEVKIQADSVKYGQWYEGREAKEQKLFQRCPGPLYYI
jgi:polyisoprenoid-binding protein YceI